MSALRWRLRYWLLRLNPFAASGALALLLAALLHCGLTAPGIENLAAQRADSAERERRLAAARMAQAESGPRGAAQAAARWRSGLPPATPASVNAVLERMQAASEAEGLLLAKGSYQLQAGAGQGVRRYSISLPVAGTYPALRVFLRQVLRDAPNLALERVSFSRGNKEQGQVEAQLEFAAYFKGRE